MKYTLLCMLALIGCKNKAEIDCQKSTVTDIKCYYSHSGTECQIHFANGKWGFGAERKVGDVACTNDFHGLENK